MKKYIIILALMLILHNIAFAAYNIQVGNIGKRPVYLDAITYNIVPDSINNYIFYVAIASDDHNPAYGLHIQTNREENLYTIIDAIIMTPKGDFMQEPVGTVKSIDQSEIVMKVIEILDEHEKGVQND